MLLETRDAIAQGYRNAHFTTLCGFFYECDVQSSWRTP